LLTLSAVKIGYVRGEETEHEIARLSLAGDLIMPSVQRPGPSIREQRVRLLGRPIPRALRCGDWESAARWEMQAAMTEHRAGLLREGLEGIFSEN
jgi:hypothetical protein